MDMEVRHTQHKIPVSFEATSSSDAASPGLSFPLGTALVLFIILAVTAIFSFCYHLEKRRRNSVATLLPITLPQNPPKMCPLPPIKMELVPSLPVMMPGEDIPTFIAWQCPHLDSLSVSKLKDTEDGKERASRAAMESKPN